MFAWPHGGLLGSGSGFMTSDDELASIGEEHRIRGGEA